MTLAATFTPALDRQDNADYRARRETLAKALAADSGAHRAPRTAKEVEKAMAQ